MRSGAVAGDRARMPEPTAQIEAEIDALLLLQGLAEVDAPWTDEEEA